VLDERRLKERGMNSLDASHATEAKGERPAPGYDELFQRSLAGIYRTTLSGVFIEVNPEFARIFGLDGPEEVYRWQAQDFYADENIRRAFLEELLRDGFVANRRSTARKINGEPIRILENAIVVRDASGLPQYIEGQILDITSLEKAEEENRRFAHALEVVHDAIMITSPNGEILYANRAAQDIYGYDREALHNKNIKDLLPQAVRPVFDDYLARAAENGRWVGEMKLPRFNGKKIFVQWAISSVDGSDEESRFLVISSYDMSERRALEENLRRAQKLETVGLLASGLAHNINSPLSAITVTAEMELAKNPEYRAFKDIMQAADRIQEIVFNLMMKSRQEQSAEIVDLDLNQLIRTELKFLEANLFFKHQVELEVNLEPELPRIQGLYSDFSQSFYNIVQNALDAMQDVEERKLSVKTVAQTDRKAIILSVRDTGCGIAQENLNRIFEPFFTTKAERNHTRPANQLPSGTGLGLSTLQNLAAKYDVDIEVKSRLGEGTEFILTIPLQPGKKRRKKKKNGRLL
jgi:PAS domain S-box-containing protein